MQLQQTQRHNVKLRLGISGASGFGKTYSALKLAYGMTNDWSKIAVIDTENASASLYSDMGNFNVLNLFPPYSPERYIEAIDTCEKANIEVIIIDSITHEWQGEGGCLQIHEQLGSRFQDWASVKPRHQKFIDKILQSKCHIITTTRRKVDYSLDVGSNGKSKVVKHGTKEITSEGYEYELSVNFELINENHLCKVSKDRTNLFRGPEFVINSDVGKRLKDWCNQGVSIEDIKQEINATITLEGLRHLYQKYDGLKTQIKPLIIERKSEIEGITQIVENKQIIQTNTNHGIESDNRTSGQ
ncbi:AAA family ATPase [Aestuariibaculum suncheonense]|uniref:AAA family ATPase n=1 Tax=Aestuariibaculum suncheonense TaxID=1028745 RepID=A0A8J6UA42_9FLAO|nr:AAA family ATPase [Aestuariibaculum suncheonense]MBD0834465.1 AAA family ATPase [Aestuariibaculum suncheonense]